MCVTAAEWDRVAPLLQADARVGRVVAPDMPGRGSNRPGEYASIGIGDYLETARAAIRDHDLRDLIVVGHSGGGACLQAIAAAEPARVRRLVFLCAAVPEEGHSLLELQPLPLRLLSRLGLRLLGAQSKGIVPNKRLARWAMCHDLTASECVHVLRGLVPEPAALLTDVIGWDAKEVQAPSTYILTTKDRIIRPKDQRRIARNLPHTAPVEIVRFPMGHAAPVLQPQALIELLLAYA
jgi:pimeloyl-ACP methyl ester carboxylesterase